MSHWAERKELYRVNTVHIMRADHRQIYAKACLSQWHSSFLHLSKIPPENCSNSKVRIPSAAMPTTTEQFTHCVANQWQKKSIIWKSLSMFGWALLWWEKFMLLSNKALYLQNTVVSVLHCKVSQCVVCSFLCLMVIGTHMRRQK